MKSSDKTKQNKTKQNKDSIMQDSDIGDIVKNSKHLGLLHPKNQEGINKIERSL